jgi:hypothetical protein
MATVRERRACISAFVHVLRASYASTPAIVSLQRMQGLTMRFKQTASAPCKQELHALIDALEWGMHLVETQLQSEEDASDRSKERAAALQADKDEWEHVATALMEELAVLQTEIKSLRESKEDNSMGHAHLQGIDAVVATDGEQALCRRRRHVDCCTCNRETQTQDDVDSDKHRASKPQTGPAPQQQWGAHACWDQTVAAVRMECDFAQVRFHD